MNSRTTAASATRAERLSGGSASALALAAISFLSESRVETLELGAQVPLNLEPSRSHHLEPAQPFEVRPQRAARIELVGLQLPSGEVGACNVGAEGLSVGRRGDELGSLEGRAVDAGLLEVAPKVTPI